MKATDNLVGITPKFLADILFKKDRRVKQFLSLDLSKQAQVYDSLTLNVKKDLLLHIPDDQLVSLIEALEPDDSTDLLQLLPTHRREIVLQKVSNRIKESLSTLLEFDADTAAGLMTLDYILVEDDKNIEYVAKKFRTHELNTSRDPVILVTHEKKLVGFIPGHQLGFAKKSERIDKYIKRMPTISYAASHDEVIKKFKTHPNGKVAVLNDGGSVIGIIFSNDVLQLINQDSASSLYDFAGIHDEESVTDSARRKVLNRYRWLIINLGTAFIAALTVGLFEETLQKFVVLAIYMPIVAGMGGNAATQTLAVQVRGIALGQIELKTAWQALRNELGAGLINGLINGTLVAAIVIIFSRDVKVAGVLAIAMIFNMLVAGFFGTLVPLLMAKLGKDPAASATIFITTATDVLGFLGFLGLATLVL